MTDSITPASLREHADHMERVHLDGISAEEMRQEAARLEAEAARDEEAREYMTKLGAQARLALTTVEGSIDHVNFAVGEHLFAVLAADGRLLPESGPQAVCRIYCGTPHPEHGVRCTMPEGHSGDHGHQFGNGEGVCWPAVSDEQERLRRNPDTDGTPEKPWPTAADVPDGAWFRSAQNRHWPARWLRCGNGSTDYADMVNPKPSALGYQVWHESAVNDHAPFVRVDGDQA